MLYDVVGELLAAPITDVTPRCKYRFVHGSSKRLPYDIIYLLLLFVHQISFWIACRYKGCRGRHPLPINPPINPKLNTAYRITVNKMRLSDFCRKASEIIYCSFYSFPRTAMSYSSAMRFQVRLSTLPVISSPPAR